MKTILGIIGLITIATIYLFVICACIISNWVSEREYKDENKYK